MGRLFPRISENFSLPPSGSGGDPKFDRMARAHRSGFEAEAAGVWDRADFYWKELWRLVLAAPGSDVRDRFLREVVVDSHAGFFLGQVAAGMSPRDRPKFHLDAISNLIRKTPAITEDEERAITDPLAAAAAGKAEGFWLAMATLFPRQQHYLNAALSEMHAGTMQKMQAADASGRLEITKKAIAEIDKLRAQSPSNPACYQLLGLLYHEQAIQQANARALQDAFLSIKKAEIHGGPNPHVVETQQQLNEVLAAMRQRAERIRETVRETPGASLTAEGQKFVSDSEKALVAATNWESSDDARDVRRGREAAQAVPDRPLVEADAETAPFVSGVATSKHDGEERFADWLASHAGRRVRWQIAAALVLVTPTSALFAYEGWAGYARRSARQRAEVAMTEGNDAAALDAWGDFFGAPAPLRPPAQSDLPLVRAYGKTIGSWVAAKSGEKGAGLSEEDRRRLLRYKKQIVDKGLDIRAEVQP